MSKSLYFDYNATTPLDPRVLEAMIPYLTEHFGNSMSLNHEFGWAAEGAVEKSRAQVADLLHCQTDEITWTSGATESNNWAIQGLVESIRREEGPDAPLHILSSAVEHPSIMKVLEFVRDFHKVEVEFVPVDSKGRLRVQDFERRLKPYTRLVCLMWVQNEVGTIFPVREVGELCREHRIYFHCDATQGIGKIHLDLSKTPIDLLSFSAHKLYGPKGVGFLFHRRKSPHVNLTPLLFGGGHERGERSGTLNVPGIVGLAMAMKIAHDERETEQERLKQEQRRFWDGLCSRIPGLLLNGPEFEAADRVVHNLNVRLPANCTLPPFLPGLAFSRASACQTGKANSSPVLKALGLSEDESQRSLRLCLGRMTRPEDIDQALEIIEKSIKISPTTAGK